MLICVKEKQEADGSGSGKFSLKGSVMIQVRFVIISLAGDTILMSLY